MKQVLLLLKNVLYRSQRCIPSWYIIIVSIKNVVIYSEYKDVLLNKKCLIHSMNRIQSKNHGIGTYDINKIYLPCFNDKIHILNNGYDGFVLDY